MYAKLSNLTEYNLLHAGNCIQNDDVSIANKYFELTEGDIINCRNTTYIWFNDKWNVDNKNCYMKLLLNKTMIDYANDFYYKQKLLYIGNEDKSKDLTKKINSYKKYCNMSQSINNIVSAVKNILTTKEQDDIFDNHPYIFCFTNKAFNLLNGEEVELTKEHYITQNTGYAYKTPTNEQTQLIDTLFCQIFPNEEIRKCCLSVFFSGMTGIPAEKFILFNGRGRNGKGLLDAHFSFMLGNDYCLKFNSVVLIKDDKDAGSANPILTQFDKKRYTFVE